MSDRRRALLTAALGFAGLATPPVLIAFDLLYVNGHNLATRPLRERRARLEDVLVGGDHWVYPVRRLAANGLQAWAEVLERGYEGLVAKDEASAYVGGATRAWLKVKQPNWADGEDRWRRTLLATAASRRSRRPTPAR